MRILRAAENREMPWKNGGGTTFEIAASPPNSSIEDFDWRISRALVTQPGPFSVFAGIDRNLSVLSGGLAMMTRDGARIDLSPASLPFEFPGEIGITAEPIDRKPVIDFNVMTRRGRYKSSVMRVEIEERVAFTDIADTVVLLVESGKLAIAGTPDAVLGPLDCLLLERPDIAVVGRAADPTSLLVAELRKA